MYAINLDKESRILRATMQGYADADYIMVESLPDGNIIDYKYINGEYVHDPLPEPEEPPAVETVEEKIERVEANLLYFSMMTGVDLPTLTQEVSEASE